MNDEETTELDSYILKPTAEEDIHTCKDHTLVLVHQIQDLVTVVKAIQRNEMMNTRARLKAEGVLEVIKWIGLSGSVAVTGLLAEHFLK